MKKQNAFLASALCSLLLVPAFSANADIQDQDFEKAMEKYLQSEKGQEKVANALETFFKKKQVQQAKAQEDAVKAELENSFKNPVKIDAGNSPVKGPASAKITIIEFSDFQCPYCSKGRETMEALLKAYPNDVKVVFKNLPLPFHPEALPAAKAALAAGKQGKFWEMHDSLFLNQGKLGADFYLAEAKKLGLNVDKFKADMASKEIEDQINAETKLAAEHGIQGTPGFFVNGVPVKGAYPIEHFKSIIDRHLKGA
jgi:protein-disulfide isomerase